jgi:hypothetical protein
MMKRSATNLTSTELKHMKDQIPGLVAKAQLTGKVLDSDMDEVNIPRKIGEELVERTDKVYYQRPSFLFTHADSISNFRAYQQRIKDEEKNRKSS